MDFARGGELQDYTDLLASKDGDQSPRNKTLVMRCCSSLAAYSADTHQDVHPVTLDYDIFEHVPKAEDLDFALKPGSAAVDKGAEIPNVTDGYTGSAPDLGALEAGQPMPHYGPR